MSVRIDAPKGRGLTLARHLFAPDIAVTSTDPRHQERDLFPSETAALPRATPKRLREFSAGRAAAHLAMAELGEPPQPVGMCGDRAPIWPEGLTGSLSHSETTCIAAVGRAGSVRAIGVDVEEDTALDADLIPIVCSLAERGWLSSLPARHQGRMAKLIFSAKECAYKCQYTLSHTLFGFDTFEITPDPDTGRFEAIFVRDVPPFSAGTHLPGQFAIGEGLIVTAMTLGA